MMITATPPGGEGVIAYLDTGTTVTGYGVSNRRSPEGRWVEKGRIRRPRVDRKTGAGGRAGEGRIVYEDCVRARVRRAVRGVSYLTRLAEFDSAGGRLPVMAFAEYRVIDRMQNEHEHGEPGRGNVFPRKAVRTCTDALNSPHAGHPIIPRACASRACPGIAGTGELYCNRAWPRG